MGQRGRSNWGKTNYNRWTLNQYLANRNEPETQSKSILRQDGFIGERYWTEGCTDATLSSEVWLTGLMLLSNVYIWMLKQELFWMSSLESWFLSNFLCLFIRHFLFKTSSGTTPLFSSSSPGYPLTSGTVYSPPPRLLPRNTFSRSAFKLKKPSKYCSWKCAAVTAIAAAALLAVLLSYFIGKQSFIPGGGLIEDYLNPKLLLSQKGALLSVRPMLLVWHHHQNGQNNKTITFVS